MNYQIYTLKKFNIKPTKKFKGKIIMKNTRTLLKNVYNKKEILIRKFKKIKQSNFSSEKSKINQIESDISEIEQLHTQLKKSMSFNNGIIEIYFN